MTAGAVELLEQLLQQTSMTGVRLETATGESIAQCGGPVDLSTAVTLVDGSVLVVGPSQVLTERELCALGGWWASQKRQRATVTVAEALQKSGHEYRNLAAVQRNGTMLVREDLVDECLETEFALECLDDSLSAGLRGRSLVERLSAMGTTLMRAPDALDMATVPSLVDPKVEAEFPTLGVLWQIDAALPPVVAERTELTRMLLDLFRNAVEAGAKHVEVRAFRAADNAAVIEVRDDGSGLRGPAREQALDAWFTTAGVRVQWGLGLTHARMCAQAWGGDLDIGSDDGPGTQVRLVVPLAE